LSPDHVRFQKLIRLAIDPAATDAEAENAGLRAIRLARQIGWKYPELARALGVMVAAEPSRARPDPPPRPRRARDGFDLIDLATMPFGKHRGRSIGWILDHDPSYLRWLHERADTIHGGMVRDAIRRAYRMLIGEYAEA
jgi:hypothetical protein